MATLTKGYTFLNNDTVTPFKLNSLVDLATITEIVDADIAAAAGISDTKLATIATANKVANSATTATSANTANAIVARDASGNFSAGTVTAQQAINAPSFGGAGAQILMPVGAVIPFPMNLVPNGWLAANGAAVSRTTYAALFAYLGTTFGAGDGSTTFNLPDLRGYFIRGFGTNSDGTASGTFGAKQADDFKSHTHVLSVRGGSASGSNFFAASVIGGTNNDRNLTATAANAGGTETRPANIAMLYCIKF